MNRIFTLLTLGLLCFAFTTLEAQPITFSFNTESEVPVASDCWTITNFAFNNTKQGPGPASGTLSSKGRTATLITPFFDLSAGQTIQFNHKASNANNTYTLAVSLISLTGNTIAPSVNPTNTGFSLYSYTVPASGTYRISIEYTTTASNQFGQNYVEIDNLIISGSYHYSDPCNLAPVAVADTYTATSFASPTVTGDVLANDSDPNLIANPSLATSGEILSVTPMSTHPLGSLALNSDGSFSFTPNASFTGGPVTFTYNVTDNGYMPRTATATVTINYPTAPVAIADEFVGPPTATSFTGNITGNDTKPADKTLTPSIVQQPSSVQVVINADGTFTYTPPATGFNGGDVIFTYRVSYDTYLPLYSNTATVTVTYPEFIPVPLPIRLLSFSGQLVNDKAQLSWSVDDNETGNYFIVQRSTDGRNFSQAALLYTTGKSGKQDYSYTESIASNKGTYYRLKIVNHDGPDAYSKTVLIKPQLTTSNQTTLTLLSNPVSATLRFTFTADQQEPTIISVYTVNGTKVLVQQLTTVRGLNYVELETSSLPKGMYILEVNSQTATRKIKFLK